MEELAFDNDIINSHPIHGLCGSTLDAVSKKDYPGEDFFDKDICCLDMDSYETITCHGQKKETMDATIGVRKFSNNNFSASRLLLVELRMDYKSEKNLSKSKMEGKINHTRELLGSDMPFCNYSLFVFRPNVIERVRRWFNEKSREGGLLKKGKAVSTDEFNNLIKSESSFPYKPLTDINNLKVRLNELMSGCKYTMFINEVEYWLRIAANYQNQYNLFEYKAIRDAISKIWDDFKPLNSVLNEDEKIEKQILEEDYGL